MSIKLKNFDSLVKHELREIVHPELAAERVRVGSLSGSDKKALVKYMRANHLNDNTLATKLHEADIVLTGDTSYGEGIFKTGTREYNEKNLVKNLTPEARQKFAQLSKHEYRASRPAVKWESTPEEKYVPELPMQDVEVNEYWNIELTDELNYNESETVLGIPFKVTTDTGLEITGTTGESDGHRVMGGSTYRITLRLFKHGGKVDAKEHITLTLYPENAPVNEAIDQCTNCIPTLAEVQTVPIEYSEQERAQAAKEKKHLPQTRRVTKFSEGQARDSKARRMLGNAVKLFRKDAKGSARKLFYYVRIPPSPGIILFPSQTTPALVSEGGKGRWRVLLLTDKDFYDKKYLGDKDTKDNLGGPYCQRAVNAQLRLNRWKSQNLSQQNTKAKSSFKDNKFSQSIYGKAGNIKDQIKVHYLGEMNNQRMLVKDKEGQPWAIIRHDTAQFYHQHGYQYLFEIDIENAFSTQCAGDLYDINWAVTTEAMEYQYYGDDPNYRASKHLFEYQDFHVTDYLSNTPDHIKKIGLYAFKGVNRNNIHQLRNQENVYLSRHPVYVSNKPKLNLAQLTDVHVSSRQHIYTLSRAQMIPGADPKDSPYLGDMVNINALSLLDLLDQVGKHSDIDALAITGDLIDHIVNLDPETVLEQMQAKQKEDGRPLNTGDIWQYMTASKELDPKIYPHHIDNLMILSLMEYFMGTYQKPIFLISGNHEAYKMPYGISPRISSIDLIKYLSPELKQVAKQLTHDMKANAGIPADHNLTISEAMTLYGPEYAHIHSDKNFESTIYEWFYRVFTPLSDYIISYNDQSFTGLEWGDGEDFTGSYTAGGGTLPRSVESCDKLQLELAKAAVDKDLACNVLLTHFTFVNYSLSLPLHKTMSINTADVNSRGSDRDNGEEGSFHKGRRKLYQHVLRGNFHYIFSGHSHRSAMYYPVKESERLIATGSGAYSMSTSTKAVTNIETQGCLPEQYEQYKSRFADCGKIIVGASGGPVSKQNINSELAGQGMDCPQATWVDLQNDSMHTLRCQQKQAKPRFAVALDYMEMVEGESPIEEILSDGENFSLSIFNILLHQDFQPHDFISALKLHILDTRQSEHNQYQGFVHFRTQKKTNGRYAIKASSNGMSWDAFNDKYYDPKKKHLKHFLSVHFNRNLCSLAEYRHYDFEQPWVYPVKIIHKKWNTRNGEYKKYWLQRDYRASKEIDYLLLTQSYREFSIN